MNKIIPLFILLLYCFTGTAQIRQTEYFFDIDPGYGKGVPTGTAYNIGNEAGKIYEELTLNVSLEGLTDGYHRLYIRTRNEAGWSQTQYHPFVKMSLPEDETNRINLVEYFVDIDPGVAKGTSFGSNGDDNIYTFDMKTDSLKEGFHILYVRAMNARGNRSQLMTHPFVKTVLPTEMEAALVAAEYYLDTDPGTGKGISIAFSGTEKVLDFAIDLKNIPEGSHTLVIRGKNSAEQWFGIGTHTFTVLSTGIDELSANAIQFYPNPVTDILFIKSGEEIIREIMVADEQGKLLFKDDAEGKSFIKIPFYEYPPGVYLVIILLPDQMKTVKIIKK